MSWRLLLITIVFLAMNPVHAQTNESWPPRPEDVLAPGIEVVQVYPVADNEARILYFYQANEWHAYPYPLAFHEIGIPEDDFGHSVAPYVYQRPDGTSLAFERDADLWYRYHAWILDTSNGTFTRMDTPCGVDRELTEHDNSVISTALYDASTWVFTQDDEGWRLCSIVTGERSELIGSPDTSSDFGYPVLPAISPDGNWAVYMEYDDSQGYPAIRHFYSYNLNSDEILSLGSIRPQFSESVTIARWIDSTHFVVTMSEMPEWSTRWIYVGNAAQSDSLDYAAAMLRFSPRVLLDPPSVEGLDAAMLDGPSAGPCFLEHYDVQTREHTLYDTGDLCEYGIPIPDGSGDRLYLALEPSVTLTRFNFRTGHRSNLFSGEIETIHSVSPGGRYAVLGLGDDGVVEMSQDPNPNWSICNMVDMYPDECLERYVHVYPVVDLTTGELIREYPESGVWITDDTILVEDAQQLMYVDGRVQDLPGEVVLPLPERGQLLLQTPDGNVVLYTVATGQQTSIIRAVDGLGLTLQRDGTLLVTIPQDTEEGSPQVQWLIRLP